MFKMLKDIASEHNLFCSGKTKNNAAQRKRIRPASATFRNARKTFKRPGKRGINRRAKRRPKSAGAKSRRTAPEVYLRDHVPENWSSFAKIAARKETYVPPSTLTLVERLSIKKMQTLPKTEPLKSRTQFSITPAEVNRSRKKECTIIIDHSGIVEDTLSVSSSMEEGEIKRSFSVDEIKAITVLQYHIRVYLGRKRRREEQKRAAKKKKAKANKGDNQLQRARKFMRTRLVEVRKKKTKLVSFQEDTKALRKKKQFLHQETIRLQKAIKALQELQSGEDAVRENDRAIAKAKDLSKRRFDSKMHILSATREQNKTIKASINETRFKKNELKKRLNNLLDSTKKYDALDEKLSNEIKEYDAEIENCKHVLESISYIGNEKLEKYQEAYDLLMDKQDNNRNQSRGKSGVMKKSRVKENKKLDHLLDNQIEKDGKGSATGAAGGKAGDTNLAFGRAHLRTQWTFEMMRMEKNVHVAHLKTYAEAFNVIKKATGVTTVDEMVEKFEKLEEKNFCMFEDLRALMVESRDLVHQIGLKKAEVAVLRAKNVEAEGSRKKIIDRIQDEIFASKSKIEYCTEQSASIKKTLSVCEQALANLINELNMDGGAADSSKNLLEMLATIDTFYSALVLSKQLKRDVSSGKITINEGAYRKGPGVATGTIFSSLPKRSLETSLILPPFQTRGRFQVAADKPVQVGELRKRAIGHVLAEMKKKEESGRTLFKLLKRKQSN